MFRRGKRDDDSAALAQEIRAQHGGVEEEQQQSDNTFEQDFRRVWGDAPQEEQPDGKKRYNLLRTEIAASPQPNIAFTLKGGRCLILAYHECSMREISADGSVLTMTFATGHVVICDGEELQHLREGLQQNRIKHLYPMLHKEHVLEDEEVMPYITRITVEGEEA